MRLYRVEKGVRKLIANHDQTMAVRQWHRLKVIMRGCQMQVLYEHKCVFVHCDRISNKGRICLGAESGAVSYFDDLHLTVFP